MHWLFILPSLFHFSLQAPSPPPEPSSSLVSRAYMQSPHTTSLKRRLYYNAKQRRSKRQTTTSATIIDNTQLRFLVPISFGDGGTLDAELDTGSSDTWLIQTGFQCYSSNSFSATSLEPQSYCNFGGTYSPGSTFEAINGVHQRSCYGNGARCVAGPLGWTSVTIAGVTVPQQVVGAPNQVRPQRSPHESH